VVQHFTLWAVPPSKVVRLLPCLPNRFRHQWVCYYYYYNNHYLYHYYYSTTTTGGFTGVTRVSVWLVARHQVRLLEALNMSFTGHGSDYYNAPRLIFKPFTRGVFDGLNPDSHPTCLHDEKFLGSRFTIHTQLSASSFWWPSKRIKVYRFVRHSLIS